MNRNISIDLRKYFAICSNGHMGKLIDVKNGKVFYLINNEREGSIKITNLDKEDQEKVKKFLNTKQKAIA